MIAHVLPTTHSTSCRTRCWCTGSAVIRARHHASKVASSTTRRPRSHPIGMPPRRHRLIVRTLRRTRRAACRYVSHSGISAAPAAEGAPESDPGCASAEPCAPPHPVLVADHTAHRVSSSPGMFTVTHSSAACAARQSEHVTYAQSIANDRRPVRPQTIRVTFVGDAMCTACDCGTARFGKKLSRHCLIGPSLIARPLSTPTRVALGLHRSSVVLSGGGPS